jgi:hypothetical protein
MCAEKGIWESYAPSTQLCYESQTTLKTKPVKKKNIPVLSVFSLDS